MIGGLRDANTLGGRMYCCVLTVLTSVLPHAGILPLLVLPLPLGRLEASLVRQVNPELG